MCAIVRCFLFKEQKQGNKRRDKKQAQEETCCGQLKGTRLEPKSSFHSTPDIPLVHHKSQKHVWAKTGYRWSGLGLCPAPLIILIVVSCSCHTHSLNETPQVIRDAMAQALSFTFGVLQCELLQVSAQSILICDALFCYSGSWYNTKNINACCAFYELQGTARTASIVCIYYTRGRFLSTLCRHVFLHRPGLSGQYMRLGQRRYEATCWACMTGGTEHVCYLHADHRLHLEHSTLATQ